MSLQVQRHPEPLTSSCKSLKFKKAQNIKKSEIGYTWFCL